MHSNALFGYAPFECPYSISTAGALQNWNWTERRFAFIVDVLHSLVIDFRECLVVE